MPKSFLTVKQFSEKHNVFSQAAIRWIVFNRESNGFNSVFRKVGKKILIDEMAFFEKVDGGFMPATFTPSPKASRNDKPLPEKDGTKTVVIEFPSTFAKNQKIAALLDEIKKISEEAENA